MELRHLRYFVAVAEELNYRKAAERLHVSQPALSSQIKDLEFDVGVKLLDRDTGGVQLTDAGTAFLEEARLIVAQTEHAVVVAQEAAKGRRGRLTLGYFAPIFMGLMPAALKAYRESFPEVDVLLVELPIVEQLAALQAGTIQIAFTVSRGAPWPRDLKNVEIARSPIGVVMGRGHRFARKSRIALAELQGEQLLYFAPKKGDVSVQGEIINQLFAARSLKVKPMRRIDGVESFRATLESGLGISLITDAGSVSQSNDLVWKPLKEKGDDLVVGLHALWRTGETSQLVLNFVKVMRGVALRLS